jgi:molecular chaperone HtpG
MKEMQALSGGAGMPGFDDMFNVVVNTNHPVVAKKLLSASSEDERKNLAKQLLDLAMLKQGMLKGADLTNFVKNNLEALSK